MVSIESESLGIPSVVILEAASLLRLSSLRSSFLSGPQCVYLLRFFLIFRSQTVPEYGVVLDS